METLAASLVIALATKAFEKLGEASAENFVEKIKSLFKADELTTLKLSAEELVDPKKQGMLEGRLGDRLKLEENSETAKELQALIDELPKTEATTNTENTQTGNNNFNAQNISDSPINQAKN